MSKHPHEQLDPTVPDYDTHRVRKRDIAGMSSSKSKVKTNALTASRTSPACSQKARPPSFVSQNNMEFLDCDASQPPGDLNNKPLPSVPVEDRLCVDIFPENALTPVFKTELPTLQDRIERTAQLVYCNSLLLRSSSETKADGTLGVAIDGPANALQDQVLDKAECEWLAMMEGEPMMRDRLRWLVSRMAQEFVKDGNKDSTEIAEIVSLGPVLQKGPFRKLLSFFIRDFEECRILNIELLQGMVQLVQCASSDYLNSGDLVKILSVLRTRLQGTHQQSSEYPYHLTLAVSRILDVMAEHNVKDLDRVLEHEPLSGILSGLQDSSDPYLMYQACYAFQALQYVLDNESPLQAVMRHSTGVVNGLVKVSGVIKLDLGSVLEGLRKLQEAFRSTVETATSTHGGVCTLLENGQVVLDILNEGLRSGQMRPWYPALRTAYALTHAGQLKDLKQLIYKASCRHDPLFQWGICQLLGEIAVDPVWAIDSRRQAVSLLGSLYKDDTDWGRDESVKTWMLTIIAKLGTVSDQVVSTTAHALLQNVKRDQATTVQHPYLLMARLLIPVSSPILAKVRDIPNLEHELYKFRLQRLQEAQKPVYIPPMAKVSLQARDDDAFPLMEKVQSFLTSDCQVMIILGDSGAGKSTFNIHLESKLLRSYISGGPIPLFINLPAIDRPDRELITEHLRAYNFSVAQIQEMKQHRQFVVICDGYDESQLTANLHTTNQFNRSGQWRVKMVISCRTQYLSQDYRGRFIPQGSSHYNHPALELFQEAVIVPFSKDQIKDYVDQYVPLEPRTWTTQDYMHKLTTIPNLMDLVRNPFLLTIALEALPGVIEGKHSLSTITVTRVQLYDTFVKHWIGVNKRRLENNILSAQGRDTLEQLMEAGFTSMAIDFTKRLASEIFDKQDGNPIVQYVHAKDENTWRVAFFGPDPKARLLRDSAPLSRTGTQYRFIHRSMLEYFFSRTVYDPITYGNGNEADIQPETDSSEAHALDADGPLFKRDLLQEPSVIQFLCERVKQSPDFQTQLLAVVHLSKVDASVAIAATNAITILVRAGVSLNGVDLRGIRIPNADLSNGWFDAVNFHGADLKGVNFSRCWLRKADFCRAEMEDVRFGELPFLEGNGAARCCGYSPDGTMFALGLHDKGIHLLDTVTWEKRYEMVLIDSCPSSLAFSPDSRRLVSGDRDGEVRIWSISESKHVFVTNRPYTPVTSVAFSPCGGQIASSSEDRTVRSWNSETGECLFILEGHSAIVRTVAYSPSGHQLVSGGDDGTIRFWYPTTGMPGALQISTGEGIRCIAWSLDGRQIAASLAGGCIRMWNAGGEGPGLIFRGHSANVTGVAFSPDGQWLASSSIDRTVRLWDATTTSMISVYSGHDGGVLSVSFSPDGRQMCSYGDTWKKSVRLWDVDKGASGLDAQAHLGSVIRVAYSSDGQSIVSGDSQGAIRQWDPQTGTQGPILLDTAGSLRTVAFSRNISHIATSRDSSIRLWNCSTGTVDSTVTGPTENIDNISMSPCGRWIVSLSSSKDMICLYLYDLQYSSKPGNLIYQHPESRWSPASCTTFSPDGRQLAMGGPEGAVTLFDPHTRSIVKTANFGTSAISALAYSPSGKQLAIGSKTAIVYIWDPLSDQPQTKLVSDGSTIRCLSYSSCGQWIAFSPAVATVNLWHRPPGENETWSLVSVVNGFFGSVLSIQWSPRGSMEFVTGCYDTSVRVWRVRKDEEGVKVVLLWGSGFGRLCLLDTIFRDAVGLSPLNQKLLTQRNKY